eukprot:TRINITY_DN3946_c0_g2_i1.p1 TRINITY_DN3946_c0_g2~~TRINITY_DN3946_c0_g2_i1.p1  ORF type:complete len:453 (+),score=58.38 TRINITY_DN3946_c0_g2_i1:45-1403(+)
MCIRDRMLRSVLVLVIVTCVYGHWVPGRLSANATYPPPATMAQVMKEKVSFWEHCHEEGGCPLNNQKALSAVLCVGGKAGEYPCNGMDLLSFTPLSTLGSTGDGNDIWGWTDEEEQHWIVISCVYNGVSFVDVTNPLEPAVLGFLPTHTNPSSWRDVKVFNNHAYIISEARNHGMQVFDLTRLRELYANPRGGSYVLTADAHFSGFGSSHNIVINEETGFAYVVGSTQCRGGLYMIDINDPKKPVNVGCFDDDRYTHDAQCVIYRGPDSQHSGKEICFAYNENSLTIVDVTDKASPKMLSRTEYDGCQYTHQGWLTRDSKYLLMNDELDEQRGTTGQGKRTRTMVWNAEDLSSPFLVGSYYNAETVIDHNLYTMPDSDLVYLSNYCGGLRVYNIIETEDDSRELEEVAYFDVAPTCSSTNFLGAWSAYPYFAPGLIAVNSIERGLFMVAHSA